MTVPDEKNGNFDLYKLEIQNPTDKPAASKLAAVLEGPPDMRLEDGVVRGLGDAPFLIADPPSEQTLKLARVGAVRQAGEGLRHRRRAGRHRAGGGQLPRGAGRRAGRLSRSRPSRAGSTWCAWSRRRTSGGYWLENPKQAGDLVYEYRVEGCAPQTLDYMEYMRKKSQPLCVRFRRGRGQGRRRLHRGSLGRGRRFADQAHAVERDLRLPGGHEDRRSRGRVQRLDEQPVRAAYQRGSHAGAGLAEPDL